MAERTAGADPLDVSVLGGGAVGIATAIHLELAGYDTAVHTAEVPFEDDGGPTLATTYAAASSSRPTLPWRT